MAAGDVELDYDLVGASVKRLLKLHDVIQQLEASVGQLRAQQTTAVWTNVSGIDTFRRNYRRAIAAAEMDLGVVRDDLSNASRALAASLRSHELRDAEEQERMLALVARLDSAATPPTPAPTSAPPAPASPSPRRSL